MHGDGGHADVFQRTGEVGRGKVLVVPTEPHLAGNGNLDGVDHRADQARSLVVVAHQLRAAAATANLADGTAHIHVHGTDSRRFEQRGGIAQLLGHRAVKLDGQRAVQRIALDELQRLAVAFQQ